VSEHSPPILCRYGDCPKYQIAGHVSGERLGDDEAGRVAISANKGKPERQARVTQASARRHNFPLGLTQTPSLDPRSDFLYLVPEAILS